MAELVDTSVWVYRRHPTIAPWFDQQLLTRQLAICEQVRLDLLYAARNVAEFQVLRSSLVVLPAYPIEEAHWTRALEIYERLAAVRPEWHRTVPHPALLIAACAESNGLPLVHYDQAFDLIGHITHQPMRWVAPAGTLQTLRQE
jgi:predicted nucleic acid-binding protein